MGLTLCDAEGSVPSELQRDRFMGGDALAQKIERLSGQVDQMLSILRPSGIKPIGKDGRLYVSQAEIEAGVERELKGLELRHRIFPAMAHQQPAWELMLVAYRHASEHRPISVSGLCHSIHAPGTTAMRHLEALVEAGLLVREKDTEDGRRYWVVLSDEVRKMMVRHFTELLT